VRPPTLRDNHAAVAQILGLPLVGFLERYGAGRPAGAVQKFKLPIDLHFNAPRDMIAELVPTCKGSCRRVLFYPQMAALSFSLTQAMPRSKVANIWRFQGP
jgi:hypothetical protein